MKTSATRRTVIKILEEQGYHTLELLLTPLQFGIPNSRLRYYLLAKARPLTFAHIHAPGNFDSCSSADRTAWRHIPGHDSPWVDVRDDSFNANPSTPEIRRYLDRASYPAQDHPCHIPDRVLEKWGRLFDIVLPSARRTCCFTRGEPPHLPVGFERINLTQQKPRLHADGRTCRVRVADERGARCS